MPTIVNCGDIDVFPSQGRKMHGFELVNIVNFRWGDAQVITIDGTLDISCLIVAFEATDDTLVIGLDMHSEIGCEVLHANVFKIIRDNMPGEVVLKE
jgi:hypothetical protein